MRFTANDYSLLFEALNILSDDLNGQHPEQARIEMLQTECARRSVALEHSADMRKVHKAMDAHIRKVRAAVLGKGKP